MAYLEMLPKQKKWERMHKKLKETKTQMSLKTLEATIHLQEQMTQI